jgi:hypothetical protein
VLTTRVNARLVSRIAASAIGQGRACQPRSGSGTFTPRTVLFQQF